MTSEESTPVDETRTDEEQVVTGPAEGDTALAWEQQSEYGKGEAEKALFLLATALTEAGYDVGVLWNVDVEVQHPDSPLRIKVMIA